MPEVSWTEMEQNRAHAHLIACVVPAADLGGTASGLKLRVDLLARLARHLQLSGSYAIADFAEGIGREVHCIVADAQDAASLADALQADAPADHPEYASHRSFRCDNVAAAAIEARLREATTAARR